MPRFVSRGRAEVCGGVDRDAKVNLLLSHAKPAAIVAAIEAYSPERAKRFSYLLTATVPSAAGSPYRGLAAFQLDDAHLFFGREAVTEKLWQRFKALHERPNVTRLLTILGPSGSGKSSVARAGLLAALKQQPVPGPQTPRCLVLKPGEHPLRALVLGMLALLDSAAKLPGIAAQRKLIEDLGHANKAGEFDGLTLWSATLSGVDASPLVVLVDQFEEVYTLCSDKGERDAFVGLLLHAASDRTRNVSIVLTLRSDFLGETQRQHSALNRLFGNQAEVLTAMSEDELRAAIAQPAEQAGRPIDDATIDLLLNETRGSEGILPLLEFALTRIWEGMQADKPPSVTLRDIGGVGGALKFKAQEIYGALNKREQAIARRALVRLVLPGEGTRYIRRRTHVADLCGRGDAAADVTTVLRKFAAEQARLVTLDGEKGDVRAEVTHEALFEHWSELRGWINDSRADRSFHDRVAEAALLWDSAQRQPGRLWRPPDLDLLRAYQQRLPNELNSLQTAFLVASEKLQRRDRRAGFIPIVAITSGLLFAGAVYVAKERQLASEARRRFHDAATAQVQLSEQLREAKRLTQAEKGARASSLAQQLPANLEAVTLGLQAYAESTPPPPVAVQGLISAALDLGYPIFPPWPLGSKTDTAQGPDELPQWLGGIRPAAFSPDGSRAVTVNEDGTGRLWDVQTGVTSAMLLGHTRWVRSASFSHDGGRIVTASWDKTARIWDARSGTSLLTLALHTKPLIHASFSQDGSRVVTTSWDQTARIWDATSGAPQAILRGHSNAVFSADFSPDGTRVLTASQDQTVRLWDALNGALLLQIKGLVPDTSRAVFAPNGRKFATYGGGQVAQVWDSRSGASLARIAGHTDRIESAAFSPDGRRLATASSDKTARLWDVESGALLLMLIGHSSLVLDAQFSSDGSLLATASQDGTARLWDAQTGRAVAVFQGHSNFVLTVLFSPNGSRMLTTCADGTARLWDARSETAQKTLGSSADGPIWKSRYSNDGRQIVVASEDGTARIWNVETGVLIATLKGHTQRVSAARLTPNGQQVLTASEDGTARLWNTRDGSVTAILRGHASALYDASISPDGSRLLTASADGTARLWDIQGPTLVSVLKGHSNAIYAVSFSPDGKLAATASWDNTARTWDARTGEAKAIHQGHTAGLLDVIFSPDSQYLLTAGQDRTARLWSVQQGDSLRTFSGHGAWLRTARFSPDGMRIATASADGIGRLFDARTGSLLAVLQGHTAPLNGLSFSPDGSQIVTASGDGTARLWDVRVNLGETLAIFPHNAFVFDVTFSPDGSRIATASLDGLTRVFSTAPQDYAKRGCDILRGHADQFRQVQAICGPLGTP